MAMQIWPELVNAPQNSRGATWAGSTSGSTLAGSLPPSSSVTRFRSSAAARMIFLPVGTLPVNEILRTSGCAVIHAPTSSLPPSTLSVPRGTTGRSTAASASDESGVKGDGLAATGVPGTGGGPILAARLAPGKIHGVRAAGTPVGFPNGGNPALLAPPPGPPRMRLHR